MKCQVSYDSFFDALLLSRVLRSGLLVWCAAFCAVSCTDQSKRGVLVVNAPMDGKYEVLRTTNSSSLQLISEKTGYFNKPLSLEQGSYIILADCSGTNVLIKSGLTHSLVADRINFVPPSGVRKGDRFEVHCDRYQKHSFRQTIANRYNANILRGQGEMLVGMVPFKLELETFPDSPPQSKDVLLAAVSVLGDARDRGGEQFFVSPTKERLSLTTSQSLGGRVLVIEGQYEVAVNSTTAIVDAARGKSYEIKAGKFKVTVHKNANLGLARQIQGKPLFVEINGGHWTDLNQEYYALPGRFDFRLWGSEVSHQIEIRSGELQEIFARSVRVDSDCSPWEWSCLGARTVLLYKEGQQYPFAKGVTDVPLLFIAEQAWLSVDGSRNIRVQIPSNENDVVLSLGTLIVVPRFEIKSNAATDLLRVEGGSKQAQGHTFDLALDQVSVVPLITGRYKLVNYVSSLNADGNRWKRAYNLHLKKHREVVLRPLVVMSEKKHAALDSLPDFSKTGEKTSRSPLFKFGRELRLN
jgi:hypothetical protein